MVLSQYLNKRVLKAQLEDTLEGDFANLVKTDVQVMEILFHISFVETTSMDFFNSFIRKKIQKAALEYLKNVQQGHSKVKDIMYDVLEIQPYLTFPIFSDEETKLLYSLRTRTADHLKATSENSMEGKWSVHSRVGVRMISHVRTHSSTY